MNRPQFQFIRRGERVIVWSRKTPTAAWVLSPLMTESEVARYLDRMLDLFKPVPVYTFEAE